jgi:hypothetical protein
VKLAELKSFLADNIHPLSPDGTPLTGPMYAAFCEHLVVSMGAGKGVPVIRDAWSLMEEIQERDCRDAAIASLREAISASRAGRLSPRRAEEALAKAVDAAAALFSRSIPRPVSVERLRVELKESVREEVERVRASDLESLQVHIDGLSARIEASGSGLSSVLSLVLEATRLARDQAHDEEWVERWNSTLLSKLLRIWLPAAGEQVAGSVADAQQAAEVHRAAALRLQEEVRHANGRQA